MKPLLSRSRAILGVDGTRVGNRLVRSRALVKYIRSDNGKVLLAWVPTRGLTACLLEPGNANQNALVALFNSRQRDACLNPHRFPTLQLEKDLRT